MEERDHLVQVLSQTKSALSSNDSLTLHSLSNQTIHSASIYQHTDYTITAIIIYTLSKLIERKYSLRIKNWGEFINKISSLLSLSIKALQDDNQSAFLENLEKIRKFLTSSVNLKPYIQDVFTKASINKGAKIYEHGISIEQTAKLLGLSQWELTEYIGSKETSDSKYARTMNVKSRAKMAMEFFQ